MNITEYVKAYGDKKLSPYNMNVSDILVLTGLSYMDFSMVSKGFNKTLKLPDAIAQMFAFGLSQRNTDFMKNLGKSERFADIELMGYRNESDNNDVSLQFSVLTLKINQNLYFISYSGTDGTVTGWKEDFQFSYLPQTPAQEKALDYLKEVSEAVNGNFIVSGHSKGGNLAAYASIFAPQKIQSRINSVYCNDSPGFNENVSIYSRNSYYNICNKIYCILPQDSIIGQLLETFPEECCRIIKSKADNLLYQHDIFNWQIKDTGEPEWLPELNPLSRLGMKKLNSIIRSLSMDKRKKFTENIFNTLNDKKILHVDALKNYLPVQYLFQWKKS